MEDGSGYTTLERSISSLGGRDIIKHDPATGKKEVLVSANSLVPDNGNKPLQISDYAWSSDGTKLLIFTNTRRVSRQNTRGDYWVFEMTSKDLYKIGGDADATRLMFATFSPDSKNIGYVYYNNVYTQNVASKVVSKLTHDGSEDIINGTFDWVYEEELFLQNGFRWSLDSKKIISMWDYVDTDRIAIWGWSGGGPMTLNMLFRYPEIYKTGMSVAPVADMKLYDTIYQEKYMGLPKDNIEGYRDGSPVNFAKNLQGNLLIVHGTGDDNVHYQNTEYIVNELIKHNKQFQMMAYPNRTHGIYEGQNTTRHLFTMLTNYLIDKMPPNKN